MFSKIFKLASLAVATVAFSSECLASMQREGKFYADIDLGYTGGKVSRVIQSPYAVTFNKNSKGLNVSGGFGYYILDELRLGLSGIVTKKLKAKGNTIVGSNVALYDKNTLKSYGLFLNGYYDFLTGTDFNPFIQLGYGILNNSLTETITSGSTTGSNKKSKTRRAMLYGIGAAYHLTQSIDLDFGVKLYRRPFTSKKSQADLPMNVVVGGTTYTTNMKFRQLEVYSAGIRFSF